MANPREPDDFQLHFAKFLQNSGTDNAGFNDEAAAIAVTSLRTSELMITSQGTNFSKELVKSTLGDPEQVKRMQLAYFKTMIDECTYKEGDDLQSTVSYIRSLINNLSKSHIKQTATNMLANFSETALPSHAKALKHHRGMIKKAFLEIGFKRQSEFFYSLHRLDKLDIFIAHAEGDDAVLPIAVKHAAIKWKNKNGHLPQDLATTIKLGNIQEADVESLLGQSEQAQLHAPATVLGIEIVEVDDLLPDGEGDAEMLPGSRARKTDEESVNKRTQPRLPWVVAALEQDGFEISQMRILKEKDIEGLASKSNPYIVLEAKNAEKSIQIALCPIIGNATYVIRDYIDFQNGAVTTIADLKKNPAVFQFNCYSETQWIRDIRHYAFTPLEKLPVQLKTRISWGDKKSAAEETFGQFYREFNQSPFTGDRSIIGHGPLAGQTTWNRFYYALQRQAIPGLEHIGNYNDMTEHVLGARAQPQTPAPEPVILEFDAQEEFRKAVLHIRDLKTLPEQDAEFARSLKAGKVSGLDPIIGDDAELITSKHEFLMCAGLAEEKEGKLVPASPVLINQLARVLIKGAPTQQIN